jgi:hypothetical protein
MATSDLPNRSLAVSALAAELLGGPRVGALNGLQLQLRIPRELGGMG